MITINSQKIKPAFQIRSVIQYKDHIQIFWNDEHKSHYCNLWLLDACRCPKCFQRDTLSVNRGNDPRRMPLDPLTQSATLENDGNLKVVWKNQGGYHESIFNASWLRVHCQTQIRQGLRKKIWDRNTDIPNFEFNEVINSDDALFKWLDSLRVFGISIINNVPKNEEAFLELSGHIGFLHTRYHPSNVFTLDTTDKVAQKIQHAYKLDQLFYHTDLTAYTDSAVIQLLHCLEYKNASNKGEAESIIVDGFKIAQVLKEDYPELYVQLTQNYAPACRRRMVAEEKILQEGGEALGNISKSNSIDKYAWESYRLNHVIQLDESGTPKEIRFNHNTRAPFNMPHKQIKAFYKAYQKFVELLESSEYTKQFLLKPGQAFVCDNARVLHGRTEVGPSLQRKVLGTYVKGESFKSRWRLLAGKKTGMSDFWLTGCSDNALEALSNRFYTY